MGHPLPVITRHAVDRFVQRHAPHLTTAEAFRHLCEAWPSAAHLRAKTIGRTGAG